MIGKIVLGLVVVAVIAFFVWDSVVTNVEHAKYTVVEKHDNVEIRDYAPALVAEVEVSGERQEAIKQGFRMIADFIFGNNAPAKQVAMTAPVIQQAEQNKSQPIAMTAPVLQSGSDNKWVVQFVMPSEYTLLTLPKPNNAAVKIKEIPSKRFAVLRFSGFATSDALQTQTDALKQFMVTKNLNAVSPVQYAFYNPPWTLPFMRRNEVMAEIKGK